MKPGDLVRDTADNLGTVLRTEPVISVAFDKYPGCAGDCFAHQLSHVDDPSDFEWLKSLGAYKYGVWVGFRLDEDSVLFIGCDGWSVNTADIPTPKSRDQAIQLLKGLGVYGTT